MVTATRTALFTDLAEYTARVARTDRDGLRQILDEHERIVRPIVEGHGGRIVKNIGDSFLCLFPAATDALRAALDVLDATRDDTGPSIRLGMSTGDVEEIDGDAFGEPVNVASRSISKTPAGEAWFGPGTRVCMNDNEVPWESVGRFRLKGIPEEQECFRLVPVHRVWLPHRVTEAARTGNLVRLEPGGAVPTLPPDPVILCEGFEPGSAALDAALAALPVLDPAAFYLTAYRLATGDRQAWAEPGRGLVIGTREAIDETIERVERPAAPKPRSLDDSSTMLLDVRARADLELLVCGLALHAVPMADVVASYSYDLMPSGRWVTRADGAVLRVEVRPSGILLNALAQGISVDGALLRSGESVALRGDAAIATPVGPLRFRATQGSYVGVLLGETGTRLGVLRGQTAEIGRKPNPPGLAFPNREGEDNIRWCSGSRAARARESGFTLDRVLSGRRQAAVEIADHAIRLLPLHEECATYLLRESSLTKAEEPVRLTVGDMVVAGTTVIEVRTPD